MRHVQLIILMMKDANTNGKLKRIQRLELKILEFPGFSSFEGVRKQY